MKNKRSLFLLTFLFIGFTFYDDNDAYSVRSEKDWSWSCLLHCAVSDGCERAVEEGGHRYEGYLNCSLVWALVCVAREQGFPLQGHLCLAD